MQCYKIRVDLSKTSLNDVLTAVKKKADAYVYVVEGSLTDNPHLHAWLRSPVKGPALRKRFRSLGLHGNKSYSCPECEDLPIEYFAYMMKENDPTQFNIPPEIWQDAKDHQADVKQEMEERKKTRKKEPTWKKLLAIIPEHTDYISILDHILDYHLEQGLMIRTSMIKCYADTIYLIRDPVNARRSLINEVMKRCES